MLPKWGVWWFSHNCFSSAPGTSSPRFRPRSPPGASGYDNRWAALARVLARAWVRGAGAWSPPLAWREPWGCVGWRSSGRAPAWGSERRWGAFWRGGGRHVPLAGRSVRTLCARLVLTRGLCFRKGRPRLGWTRWTAEEARTPGGIWLKPWARNGRPLGVANVGSRDLCLDLD